MAMSPGVAFGLVSTLIVLAIVAFVVLGVAIIGHIIVFVWHHLAITMGVFILIIAGIVCIFKKY